MRYKTLMPDAEFRRAVRLRRAIHCHPELAYDEHNTAAMITKELGRLKIPFHSGIGGTGVVGRIQGKKGAVALRADMDALAVEEQTGLPFKSRRPGLMHACGHDGHVAMMLAAAGLLKRAPSRAAVVMLFQPAEEGGAGARKLIEAGSLEGVGMVFGGHIEGRFPPGHIGIRRNIDTAFTDGLDITVKGKGGHAARPHETADAVVISSHLVMALQHIVSRGVNPVMPAVITIGTLHAGTAGNVISPEARLTGTIRTIDPATRRDVIRKVRETARSIGALYGGRIDVRFVDGYPRTVNHPAAFELALECGLDIFGRRNVHIIEKPSMGGEDFAYYLRKKPGCFVRIGGAIKGKTLPAHSPVFDFDEEAIRAGAVYFAELARRAGEIVGKRGG